MIENLTLRKKGKAGEQLVKAWALEEGIGYHCTEARIQRSRSHTQWSKIEVKLSILWEGGSYKFQQIRDQDYDYMLCFGISPFDVHDWLIPKKLLRDDKPGLGGQHGGKNSKETKALQSMVDKPPTWLEPYGDDFQAVKGFL